MLHLIVSEKYFPPDAVGSEHTKTLLKQETTNENDVTFIKSGPFDEFYSRHRNELNISIDASISKLDKTEHFLLFAFFSNHS